jgi:hypothetical protein
MGRRVKAGVGFRAFPRPRWQAGAGRWRIDEMPSVDTLGAYSLP